MVATKQCKHHSFSWQKTRHQTGLSLFLGGGEQIVGMKRQEKQEPLNTTASKQQERNINQNCPKFYAIFLDLLVQTHKNQP